MAANNWWEWEEDGASNSADTKAFVLGLEQANQQRLDAQQIQDRIRYDQDAERDRRLTKQARGFNFSEAWGLEPDDRINWLMGEESPFAGQQHFGAWVDQFKQDPLAAHRLFDSLGGWDVAIRTLMGAKERAAAIKIRNEAYGRNMQHLVDPLLVERMRVDSDYEITKPYAPDELARELMPRITPQDVRHRANEQSPLYDVKVIGAVQRAGELGALGAGRIILPLGLWTVDQLMRFNHGLAGAAHQLAKESNAHRYSNVRRLGQFADPETFGEEKPVLGGATRVFGAGLRGFALWDRYVFEDVLAEVGMEDPGMRSVIGFIGDVIFDPLTWIAIGSGVGIPIGVATIAAKAVLGKGVSRAAIAAATRAAAEAAVRTLPRGARPLVTRETKAVIGRKVGAKGYQGQAGHFNLSRQGERYMNEYVTYYQKSAGVTKSEAIILAREEMSIQVMAGTAPKGIIEQGGVKLRAGIPFANWTREKVLIPGDHFEVAGGWLVNQVDRLPRVDALKRGLSHTFRPPQDWINAHKFPTTASIMRQVPRLLTKAQTQAHVATIDEAGSLLAEELVRLRQLKKPVRVLAPATDTPDWALPMTPAELKAAIAPTPATFEVGDFLIHKTTAQEATEKTGFFRGWLKRVTHHDDVAHGPRLVQEYEELTEWVRFSDKRAQVAAQATDASELAASSRAMREAGEPDLSRLENALARDQATRESVGRHRPATVYEPVQGQHGRMYGVTGRGTGWRTFKNRGPGRQAVTVTVDPLSPGYVGPRPLRPITRTSAEQAAKLETLVEDAVARVRTSDVSPTLRRMVDLLSDPAFGFHTQAQVLRALDSHIGLVSREAHNLKQIQRKYPDLDVAHLNAEELQALDARLIDEGRVPDSDWAGEEIEAFGRLETDLTDGRITQQEFDEGLAAIEQGGLPQPLDTWLELEHMRRYSSEAAYTRALQEDVGVEPFFRRVGEEPGAAALLDELLTNPKQAYERVMWRESDGTWKAHDATSNERSKRMAVEWLETVLNLSVDPRIRKALLRTPNVSATKQPLVSRVGKQSTGLKKDLSNLSDLHPDHPMRQVIERNPDAFFMKIEELPIEQRGLVASVQGRRGAGLDPGEVDPGAQITEDILFVAGTEEIRHIGKAKEADVLARARSVDPDTAIRDTWLANKPVRSRSQAWTERIEAQEAVVAKGFRDWHEAVARQLNQTPAEAVEAFDTQLGMFLSTTLSERAKLTLGDERFLSEVQFFSDRLSEFLRNADDMSTAEQTGIRQITNQRFEWLSKLSEAERRQLVDSGPMGMALMSDVRRVTGVDTPGLSLQSPTNTDIAENFLQREVHDPGYNFYDVVPDEYLVDRAGRIHPAAAAGPEVRAEALRAQQARAAADVPVEEVVQRRVRQAELGTTTGRATGEEFERIVARGQPATPTQRERAIQAKLDAGLWDQADAAYVRQYANVMELIREMDRAMGFQYAEIPDYVYHIYKNAPWKVEQVLAAHSKLHPDWMMDPATPWTKQRQFETLKVAKENGLDPIEDLASIAALRAQSSFKAEAHLKIQRDMADVWKDPHMSKTIYDEAQINPEGMVEYIASDAALVARGELRGVMIPREVAETIRALFQESLGGTLADKAARWSGPGGQGLQKLLVAYDWGNRMFKSGAVRSISFTARNMRTNVLNSMLDIGLFALHPVYHVHALQIMNGLDLDKQIRLKDGSMITRREVLDGARDHFVLGGGGILGARDFATDARGFEQLTESTREVVTLFRQTEPGIRGMAKAGLASDLNLARFFYDPHSPMNRVMRSFNTGVESHARLVLYMRNLWLTGGDHAVAAQRVNKYLFDYQNGLSWAEREIIRRIIPFYTFSRKNIPLVTEHIFREPGRSILAPKVLRAAHQTGGPLIDEPANEDGPMSGGESNLLADPFGALPVYQQKQIGVVWGKDKKNRPIIMSGFDLPIEELNILAWGENPLHELAREFLQRTSPWAGLRAPIEALLKKSSFTGGDIDDPEIATYYERLPESFADLPKISEWLGIETEEYTDHVTGETHTNVRANPVAVYWLIDVFGSIIGARRMTSLVQRWEQANDPDTKAAGILNLTMGLSLNTVDPTRTLTFSDAVAKSYAAHTEGVRLAILGFSTPGDDLYHKPGALRHVIEQYSKNRSVDLKSAFDRRVNMLEGSEQEIERYRQELIKIYRAPGLEGAIDARRQVKPERTGVSQTISPDGWELFHRAQEDAVWAHAQRGGGTHQQQVERYWLYQEAIQQVELDRMADDFKGSPELLEVRMHLWEAEQNYRKLHEIPRYRGLDLKASQKVGDIVRAIRVHAQVIGAGRQVAKGQYQNYAVVNWASLQADTDVGAENRDTTAWKQTQQKHIHIARLSLKAAQKKNPKYDMWLLLHPDIQYWFWDGWSTLGLNEWEVMKQRFSPFGAGGSAEEQRVSIGQT